MQNVKCSICGNSDVKIWCEKYLHCEKCKYVWIEKSHYPNPEAEKKRYEQHENTAENSGYTEMFEDFLEKVGDVKNKKILDFGCGPNPVLAEMMCARGAEVTTYDKYFCPQDFAQKKYDLITLTEVFEHLHAPMQTLHELKTCLKPDGKIALMTNLREGNEQDFANWWYRRDFTHVCFLAKESLKYLEKNLEMCAIFCDDVKIIVLQK